MLPLSPAVRLPSNRYRMIDDLKTDATELSSIEECKKNSAEAVDEPVTEK